MTVSYQNSLYSSQDYSSDVALASLQSSSQQQQQQMFGSTAGPLPFRSAAITTEHPAIGAARHQHQHQLRHLQHPQQPVYLQHQLPQQHFQPHPYPQSHLFLHSVPFRHRPASTPLHVSNMADQQQQEQQPHLTEEELSQLQKLSAEYQPEHSGPLVSERLSTASITTEYAGADPTYRQKTEALPQKFHQYRTCRGDGHCGWRAIAFTYFEALQAFGDIGKFAEEHARIVSLRNLISSANGFSYDIFEDFEEPVIDLLTRLRDETSRGGGGRALLEAFNDENVSLSILTYFKMLTSAWIKAHRDDFEPFLGISAEEYCSSSVDPVMAEMENTSLAALWQVLLRPLGITLEVMYLDRSPGTEINEHRWEPENVSGHSTIEPPTITLLYRPGHYDVMYKAPPRPMPPATPASNDVFVGIANRHDHWVPEARVGSDIFTSIPGMQHASFSSPQWGNSAFDVAATSPLVPVEHAAEPLSAYASVPQTPVETSLPPASIYDTPPVSAAALQAPPMSISLNSRMVGGAGGPFRTSEWMLDPLFGTSQPQTSPCQTSIFRNSHYNTAHYLNPDFQPEEWDPTSEYATGAGRGRNR